MKKGDEGVTPPKKRYHALRLAMEANRLAVGSGEPRVWFEPGPERDELLGMRAGNGTEEEFLKRFESLLEPTRGNAHGYPATSDVTSMEPMLVRVRLTQLHRVQSSPLETLVGALHGDEALRVRALDLLDRAGLARGSRLLFVGISGSQLHGGGARSEAPPLECDYVGIFMGPIECALGFEVPAVAVAHVEGSSDWRTGKPSPSRHAKL